MVGTFASFQNEIMGIPSHLQKLKKKKKEYTRYIKSIFIKVLEIKRQKTLIPERLKYKEVSTVIFQLSSWKGFPGCGIGQEA